MRVVRYIEDAYKSITGFWMDVLDSLLDDLTYALSRFTILTLPSISYNLVY